MSERCYFQIHHLDGTIHKLKLADDCPLIHLFQHPRLGLPPSLDGLVFQFKNITELDFERTPSFYQMGTGERNVNVITIGEKKFLAASTVVAAPNPSNAITNINNHSSSSSALVIPRTTKPQQQVSFPHTTTSHRNNNNNDNVNVLSPRQEKLQEDLFQQQERQHRREIDLLKSEANNTIESLENRLRSQQQTITSLKQRNQRLEDEVQQASNSQHLLEQQNKRRSDNENEALVRELSQLQDAVSRAENSSKEQSKYKAKFGQIDKSYTTLQEDFNRLQEVCRGYREQLDKRMGENSELRTDLDSVQRENEKLLNECELGSQYAIKLAAQDEKARERKEANRALILDLQNQQNMLSEQLSATRAALEREVNNSAEVRRNFELAVQDLRESRSAAKDSDRLFEEEMVQRRTLESQLDHEKRRRASEKKALLNEIAELERSLKASERNVTGLEEALRIAESNNNNNNTLSRNSSPTRMSTFSAKSGGGGRGYSSSATTNNNNNNNNNNELALIRSAPTSHSSSVVPLMSSNEMRDVAPSANNYNYRSNYNNNNNNNQQQQQSGDMFRFENQQPTSIYKSSTDNNSSFASSQVYPVAPVSNNATPSASSLLAASQRSRRSMAF